MKYLKLEYKSIMTKPENMLKEEQKQVKNHLTDAQKYPTKLSEKDKKMIKEKYQGRFSVNYTCR